MRFIVKLRLKRQEEGQTLVEWPEKVVDAEDKYGALVQVSESLGLSRIVPMYDLWKMSSIKKMRPTKVKILRSS
jgi:hypothetical protein